MLISSHRNASAGRETTDWPSALHETSRRLGALATLLVLLFSAYAPGVYGWSNGGYSSDANNPDYGTHDFLAQHALDWIPDGLDFWIRDNLVTYLYGTELPDNANAPLGDGIGDQTLHHVYYYASGQLQDDASAQRAQSTFQQVLSYLAAKDYKDAAKWMGITSHYLDDVGVFGHVMGSSTNWGAEKHHSDYEDWVNSNTNSYGATFTSCLGFDGKLEQRNAHDATLTLAHDTTFDDTGKGHTAKWMDDNYNPSDATFKARTCESISFAANLLADVIFGASNTIVKTIPVSSIANDVVDEPAKSVVYVLPDWQAGSGHMKPPGVIGAQLSDFTALGFMFGASANTQIMAMDTNGTYFYQTTGAPKISNGVLVVFAGPAVNGVVQYYETNHQTPLYFQYATVSGTFSFAWYNWQGGLVASMPVSVGHAGKNDMFLLEYFTDSNNNKVFMIYGFTWKGTYVGGVFFKTYVLPNLAGFTHGWYIYQWNDANANGLPDPYEINTTPVNYGD